METCPTCHFLIPPGARSCQVCKGDLSFVAAAPVPPKGGKDTRTKAERSPSAGRIGHRPTAEADTYVTPSGPTPMPASAYLRGATDRPAAASRLARVHLWVQQLADAFARNRRHALLAMVSVVGVVGTTLVVAPDPARKVAVVAADVAPVDSLEWRTVRPDGTFGVAFPGEPAVRADGGQTQYRVDLGGVALTMGSVAVDGTIADPLGYLRTVAARTGDALKAPASEVRVNEHPWGPSIDVRFDTEGALVLVRLTLGAGRLFVLEGDVLPALAEDPASEALRVQARFVESFTAAP